MRFWAILSYFYVALFSIPLFVRTFRYKTVALPLRLYLYRAKARKTAWVPTYCRFWIKPTHFLWYNVPIFCITVNILWTVEYCINSILCITLYLNYVFYAQNCAVRHLLYSILLYHIAYSKQCKSVEGAVLNIEVRQLRYTGSEKGRTSKHFLLWLYKFIQQLTQVSFHHTVSLGLFHH